MFEATVDHTTFLKCKSNSEGGDLPRLSSDRTAVHHKDLELRSPQYSKRTALSESFPKQADWKEQLGQANNNLFYGFSSMLRRLLSALAIASSVSTVILSTSLVASAQEPRHYQAMEADSFSLWKTGEMSGIAFDIWRRPAALGGGYYYFLWQGQYANVVDTADPEVVVFFEGNIAQLKSAFLVDCHEAPDSDTFCLNPDRKPAHYRHVGPCAFPWQRATDGSVCGDRAAIVRPGGF